MPLHLSRFNLSFIALVGAYVLMCWGLVLYTGHGAAFSPLIYLGAGVRFSFTFALIYILYRLLRAVYLLVKDKPKRPSAHLLADLKKGPLRAELYTRALPIFIAFIFFFSTFTSMKFLIAQINPFMSSGWDEFFMNADRALHFGRDPWQLLQPLLGHPLITKALSFAYILWLPLFFLVLYWQLFQRKDEALRMRFFYSFVLIWAINGTFMAIAFSSAGPCFYENVTGGGTFTPLMDYLYSVHEHTKIYALPTQESLWENYVSGGNMLGGGISAFPSVHVATAFLFVLLTRHKHKLIFSGFIAFFIAIMLGSVHLGWHYAVDGYFAILSTWGIWWGCGRLTKKP